MRAKDVFFSFDGRMSRSDFWLKGYLPLCVAGILSVLLFHCHQELISIIGFFTGAFNIWATAAVYTKRLHDRNISGKVLFLCLIPIVCFFAWIWLITQTWFLRGTTGENHFGPDSDCPDGAGVKNHILRATAAEAGVEFLGKIENVPDDAVKAVPRQLAHRLGVMPLHLEGRHLRVSLADPFNFDAIDTLSKELRYDIDIVVSPSEEIDNALKRHYGSASELSIGKNPVADFASSLIYNWWLRVLLLPPLAWVGIVTLFTQLFPDYIKYVYGDDYYLQPHAGFTMTEAVMRFLDGLQYSGLKWNWRSFCSEMGEAYEAGSFLIRLCLFPILVFWISCGTYLMMTQKKASGD